MTIGQRIPSEYFVTSGSGQSNRTIHAGSFHHALKDAGIEMCNIIQYSSIMPAIAKPGPRPVMVHGSVLEAIMSVCTVQQGQRGEAAIAWGSLYNAEGEYCGGLVCEREVKNRGRRNQPASREAMDSVVELFENGYEGRFTLGEIQVIEKTIEAEMLFATVLVAICFTKYEIPILGKQGEDHAV